MRQTPVYPVIMCGGSGTRLWPASRPSRPKQFIPLVGEQSLLQETVARVGGLAAGGGRLVIVAGAAHGPTIQAQLAEIGADATVILEPEPRDSAAAITIAAAWIGSQDPDAVAVIVASDHHVPDHAAFRDAVEATVGAAREGAIVTLGVRPAGPATAYGYIHPAPGEGVRSVEAFVEKPDAERAAQYVAQGFLWNSGNFVASARTLLDELQAHAPDVLSAVRSGLSDSVDEAGALRLGDAFRAAPKISFDYAVMEKTTRAAVLPVDFAWSDLGAWDTIWSASPKDAHGNSLPPAAHAIDSTDLLVRAPAGVRVAVIGASRLAVVVEPDAVLVCALDSAQAVKGAAEAAAPGAPEARTLTSLREAAAWFQSWLETAALPVWATLGVDPGTGAFREGLSIAGAAHDPYRRIRTLTRQVMVYALSSAEGRPGPWAETARCGFAHLQARARRPDGLFVSRLGADDSMIDDTPRLYEHDFALQALCAMHGLGEPGVLEQARDLKARLAAWRHDAGGFRETGPHPFQANAHMHLFEAAQSWAARDPEGGWDALADEIAELALARFIDSRTGMLSEFFDAGWTPLTGEAGLVEPGHHFEWAWLLTRWGTARGNDGMLEAARRLYGLGRRGVDARRGVAMNAVWEDFTPRDVTARLWPQTEFLKAALILGETEDALTACNALRRYLDTPVRGVWRDRMRADGSFVEEAAPATSFYHLHLAVAELQRLAGA